MQKTVVRGGEGDSEIVKASSCADENPDLFYRLKLKLWNRDRMTNAVRTPYDKESVRKHDVAHWKVGTRVVITEEGDMHTGKAGRLIEYRGRGWYAVLMEDGHKVTFSPMQWERMANQKGNGYTPLPSEGIRAAHRALELAEGKYAVARDGSPGHFATPASGKGWKKKSGTGGDVGMETTNTTSAASQWNPPAGTRVRIIRTYGGVMLPKDEIRTGETHMFAHGWYYITLDDGGKQESYRRNSFVVVGDEEDILLGFYHTPARGEGAPRGASRAKGASDACTSFYREGGEGSEGGDKEPVRTYSGKKRGRKPKERVEESESEEEEEEGVEDESEVRKKGKKGKSEGASRESREEEDARIKKEREEARRRREKELEDREREREREKERERERQREEEAKAEANMTQEERDAIEAARLAAMLNRNPRRRGGDTAPPPSMLPLFFRKKK